MEKLYIPEESRNLDILKARYLSSHIQYKNSVIEIENNIDPQYQLLKSDFTKCVEVTLPHLSTIKNSEGETVVVMESLNKTSLQSLNRNNGISLEEIKQMGDYQTFFIPSTLGTLEVYGTEHDRRKYSEGIYVSHNPIFNEDLTKENPHIYPNIQYGRIYPQINPSSSLNSMHKFLNEAHFQNKKKHNVPGVALYSLALVENRINDYLRVLKRNKKIHGKFMNNRLRQFMETTEKFSDEDRFHLQRLRAKKSERYVIELDSYLNMPIIQKDFSKYGIIPELKYAEYSDVFDLALPAEDVIIQDILSEEDQENVYEYLNRKMEIFCK